MPKERSPGLTAVSISIEVDALTRIDARAAQLGLSRSAYMGLMALQGIAPAANTVVPAPAQPTEPNASAPLPQPLDLTAEVYDFLLVAIPALEEYEASKSSGGAQTSGPLTVEIPPDLAESKLWRFFLLEREEILKLKWIESQKAGYDLGFSRAIQIWLSFHRALWIAGLDA